ncbi:DUF1077-domain-containing protein, partial [Gonapodya prolifera JEL478]
IKKAWEAALGPAKTVPMNAFMLWMSGSGVQIFSIMMLYMLFSGGVQGITKVTQTFERFAIVEAGSSRADPLLLPKIIYVALQLAVIALGVWKLSSMGLLPTAQSDWLAFLQPKQVGNCLVKSLSHCLLNHSFNPTTYVQFAVLGIFRSMTTITSY